MTKRRTTFLILLVAIIASNTSANGKGKKSPPELGVSASQLIPVGPQKWPKVTVNVLALNQAKEPFAMVDSSALGVSEDHIPQTIQSVAGPGTPVSLGILIDQSGSTRSLRAEIDDATVSLIKSLPPDSEAMVAAFAGESVLVLQFTSAAGFDRGMLKYPVLRGGTALFDALAATDRYFVRHARHDRRALVVIADGEDNVSEYKLDEAIRLMQTPDSPLVFALRIPQPEGRRRDTRVLDKLTRAAGGSLFQANEERDIRPAAAKISQTISDQYALAYTSTQTTPGDHLRQLIVTVSPGGPAIQAAPGYYPPRP